MKLNVLFSGLLLIALPVCGQIRWERAYGGRGQERGLALAIAPNDCYIVAGTSTSLGPGDNDVYLVKVDAAGDTIWTRSYGGTSEDLAFAVETTSDSGFIVAGWTTSSGSGGSEMMLLRTDAAGETLWTRSFGGPADEYAHAVKPTADGGFVLAGSTCSFGAGGSDIYVVRTTAGGNTLWTRTYGGTADDGCNALQLTPDGGFILAGYTASIDTGNADIYLVRLNAQGDTDWTRTYDGPADECAYALDQTPDSGYLIAGATNWTEPVASDVRVLRTDSLGAVLWTYTYGGEYCDMANSVEALPDGGCLVAGVTGEFSPDNGDLLLIRLDRDGDTAWTRTYGGPLYDWGYSARQTRDSGFIVAGYTFSAANSFDVYLVKTDTSGSVGMEESVGGSRTEAGRMRAAPDPFVSFTRVPGREAERFEVRDVSGRMKGICLGSRIGDGLPSGVYLIRPVGATVPGVRVVKVR